MWVKLDMSVLSVYVCKLNREGTPSSIWLYLIRYMLHTKSRILLHASLSPKLLSTWKSDTKGIIFLITEVLFNYNRIPCRIEEVFALFPFRYWHVYNPFYAMEMWPYPFSKIHLCVGSSIKWPIMEYVVTIGILPFQWLNSLKRLPNYKY